MNYFRICIAVFLFLLCTCIRAQQGFFLESWQARTVTAPAFTEAQKPAATAGTSIAIDINTIITKVPPTLFGNNANPYMTQMVTEPVLIGHIRSLAPHIIRFPGGNLSSIYFWNDQPGSNPKNTPDSLFDSEGKAVKAFYWYGKNNDSWTLSLANYYNMLQQTNSTGIITANYSYARYGLGENPVADAAHMAAEWVRYDSGRTKYWEIGNEDAGPWQAGYKINTTTNKDGQPEIINGALYGKHFKVFADSMHKAAAETGKTIYVGAQLIQYDAVNSWNPTDRAWNEQYFSEAGNEADFYIIHSYYTPFAENTNAANILKTGADETIAMMNWMKTTTTRAGVEMKPIALTEWNIFAEGSMQSVSHINGMHAALVLGELVKQRYGLATRWDLANGWSNGNDHGTFNSGDEPGGVPRWNPRPSFYHMYFFQQYFGDQMVQSTVTGNSDIVSYASTFSSSEIGMVIVNKGTTSQVVKINSPSFTVGRYYWYTLSGSNDNGEFSRKVLVNGSGPAGVAGGPADYQTIRARSAIGNNDVKVELPARSAVYMLLEKGEITGIADIDPADKLVKVYPNPTRGGAFELRLSGILSLNKISIQLINMNGQTIQQIENIFSTNISFSKPLAPGVYRLVVRMQQGVTVKTIVVQ